MKYVNRTLIPVVAIMMLASPVPTAAQNPEPAGLPAITPLTGTGTIDSADSPQKFTFVVFGDNRPGEGEAQPETITEILDEIRELKPVFALSLGDIIEGKPKPDDPAEIERVKKQLHEFLAMAAKAETPIVNAPGNHEMDDVHDVPTERMHQLYRDIAGPTYGAFDYGNSRFIVLNTEDVPPAGTPAPPADEEFSYMSQTQLDQLKADLEASRDKDHIFVIMHYPIHALYEGPPESEFDDRLNPESREALLEIFAGHDNIAYVLSAHEHVYYNPAAPDDITNVPGWKPGDPIRYLISGGAGAPLNPPPHGFHHYLVFTVDGPEVSVRLVRLESTGAGS